MLLGNIDISSRAAPNADSVSSAGQLPAPAKEEVVFLLTAEVSAYFG